jgi:hypothetical protein
VGFWKEGLVCPLFRFPFWRRRADGQSGGGHISVGLFYNIAKKPNEPFGDLSDFNVQRF